MATHQKKHNKSFTPKELIYRNPKTQFYATVNKSLGDARFEVIITENNDSVIAKARGRLTGSWHKQRIEKFDLVLIDKDESTSSTKKYFIIHKYTSDEAKQLKKAGELSHIKEIEETKSDIVFDSDVVERKTDETTPHFNIDDI